MTYQVRRARMTELNRILEIYAYARSFMASTGNPNQWGSAHPPAEQLVLDIQNGCLFVVVEESVIHGVFYFYIGEDSTYKVIHKGAWNHEKPYGTIHRIAGDGSGGILKAAVTYCKTQIDYLRIDTHEDNRVMQRAVEKQGFTYCGIIYISDGSPRLAYDLLV